MPQPDHVPHRGRVAGYRHGRRYYGPYVAVYGNGGGKGTVAQWQTAMGIDWTDERTELAEAIPPAYTQHLGRGLIESLTGRTNGPTVLSAGAGRGRDERQLTLFG
ncbi:hypothetical protein [Nocardia sp. NPDC005825]|uniref:hypothetical protein n=1 Tax=unclassified Nocardia TaxID=2637762 RepID=UPI0033E9E286